MPLAILLICAVFCTAAGAAPLGQVTEYSAGLPAHGNPYDILEAPDGNLWFDYSGYTGTGYVSGAGRVTPGGTFTTFNEKAGGSPLTVGPDGNLWFTTQFNHDGWPAIGKLSTSGVQSEWTEWSEFPPPAPNPNDPREIISGPSGDLWYTDGGAVGGNNGCNEGRSAGIGRITTAGSMTEFTGPLNCEAALDSIVVGPDGNLWAPVQWGQQGIVRVTPAGAVTLFSSGLLPGALTNGISTIIDGPDGNLWFNDIVPRAIGRITPNGQITEFSTLPSAPQEIAAGPDGDVWFTATHEYEDQLERMAPDGSITNLTADLSAGVTHDLGNLMTGPDGNVWFTDYAGSLLGIEGEEAGIPLIGRITPDGEVAEFDAGMDPGAVPEGRLAIGPEESIWFTDDGEPPAVGKVLTSGTLSRLDVGIAGTGAGIVRSTPFGVVCSNSCSANFGTATMVTLTATPEPGSSFGGWSGAGCSGAATCTVALDSDASVGASFASTGEVPSGGGGSPGAGGSAGPGASSPPASTPPAVKPTPAPAKPLKCKKGFLKKKVHGKPRCVKKPAPHKHKKTGHGHKKTGHGRGA